MSLNLELTIYMKKRQGYTKIKKLTLNDPLELNNSVTIHQRDLQIATCNKNIQAKKQFST